MPRGGSLRIFAQNTGRAAVFRQMKGTALSLPCQMQKNSALRQ